MAEEIHELAEHAHHGAHDEGMAIVTITMAVLAVLVAVSSLMGHRTHTEELLAQTRATDEWAYYQAKDIRRRSYEVFLDQMTVFTLQNPQNAAAAKDKYEKQLEVYAKQLKELEAAARELETEVAALQRRADRYDLGEVLLEAALVICSITLLTKKRAFWGVGVFLGTAGVAIALTALFIR
jgi:hypothetical protein